MADTLSLARAAKAAALSLPACSAQARNAALSGMADALADRRKALFSANEQDLEQAQNLPAPLQKRLKFNQAKLDEVLAGLKSLQSLHTRKPVNQTQNQAKAAGKDSAKEQRKVAKKG